MIKKEIQFIKKKMKMSRTYGIKQCARTVLTWWWVRQVPIFHNSNKMFQPMLVLKMFENSVKLGLKNDLK